MDITIPKLAEAQLNATVTRWLKQPGDAVKKGETIVEVETEKVNAEVEAPSDGVMGEILVRDGETAPVGEVIGRLTT